MTEMKAETKTEVEYSPVETRVNPEPVQTVSVKVENPKKEKAEKTGEKTSEAENPKRKGGMEKLMHLGGRKAKGFDTKALMSSATIGGIAAGAATLFGVYVTPKLIDTEDGSWKEFLTQAVFSLGAGFLLGTLWRKDVGFVVATVGLSYAVMKGALNGMGVAGITVEGLKEALRGKAQTAMAGTNSSNGRSPAETGIIGQQPVEKIKVAFAGSG